MATVLLVVHLMIAVALVGVVLLQRSEGGALGIGGGGGGGFLTGRGTANLLTRITAGLAAAFFVTSLGLTLLAQHNAAPRSIVGTGAASTSAPTPDGAPAVPGATPAAGTPAATGDAAPAPRGGILDKLQGTQPVIPQSK